MWVSCRHSGLYVRGVPELFEVGIVWVLVVIKALGDSYWRGFRALVADVQC